MQAIININLGSKINPAADLSSLYVLTNARVRKFFPRAVGEIRKVEHEDQGGQESTAVITFEFASQKNIVLDAVNQLSRDFNQDCIAILFDDGDGRLIGPKADLWGPFKIERFLRPAFFELLKEAA